jgi:hypothetical protein
MVTSTEVKNAEKWVREQGGSITRNPWADGTTIDLIVSVHGMSREARIIDETPEDYPTLVVDLVSELRDVVGELANRE